MTHVPVLDQGKIGSCYAYSAAQMLDAWRFGHGVKPDGRHIRPEALAIDARMLAASQRSNLDGGWTKDALQAGLSKGCIQWKADPAKLQTWLSTAGNTAANFQIQSAAIRSDEEYLAKLDDPQFCKEMSDGGFDIGAQRAQCQNRLKNRRASIEQSRSKIATDCRSFAEAGGAPGDAILKLNSQLQEIFEKGGFLPLAPAQLTRDAVACDPKNVISIPEPKPTPVEKNFTPGDGAAVRAWLNQYFEKPTQPIEVDFCSKLLEHRVGGRKYKFVDRSEERCGLHAALIIGRRKTFFGRCQYLLRNSWGTRCDRYNFDWDCESGNIWVDEETLVRNSTATTHLKP